MGKNFEKVDGASAAIIRRKAKQLIRGTNSRAEEVDDYEQELREKLWLASESYDPAKASPETFAARVVANHAANLVEARRSGKRMPPAAPQSPPGGHEVVDIADLRAAQREIERDHDLEFDVRRAVAKLPPRHQELCQLLAEGGVTHVAEASGRSRSGVYESLALIRHHFERAGLRAHLVPDTLSALPVHASRRKA